MSKTLVAWFSAEGGSTKLVAEKFLAVTGGDAFEIQPEKPYSKADMNYTNPLSRCNREQIGKKDVPIANTVPGFETYDTIYIGFPIWYYNAPMIIKTFVKSYDFTGKKIVLFATSGGSDIGATIEKLKPFVQGDAEILGATVFSRSATEDTVKAFVESL